MAHIVLKCHGPLGHYARLEKERLRHQERANKEATRCVQLEEHVEKLERLLRQIREGRQPCVDRGLQSWGSFVANAPLDQIDSVLAERP